MKRIKLAWQCPICKNVNVDNVNAYNYFAICHNKECQHDTIIDNHNSRLIK